MSPRAQTPAKKLGKYVEKRNFRATPEPSGDSPGRRRRSEEERRFVIQKHAARRLHWDLRLQIGGALASWAVTKEPTMDPAVRRLAIHVEDHPLEYASFEGDIPKGNYGAGTVEIWDEGTYTPEGDPEKGVDQGKISFELHGKRLSGWFALVKIQGEKGNEWLLVKESKKDAGRKPAPVDRTTRMKRSTSGTKSSQARTPNASLAQTNLASEAARLGVPASRLPKSLAPMLCTASEEPPQGDDWLYEVKWDGYRVLARVEKGTAQCFSRNGNRIRLPEIEGALSDASIDGAWIDGEVVAFDERGVSQFNLIQNALAKKQTDGLVFYAFDLPFALQRDLREEPLVSRKALLAALLDPLGDGSIRFSEHSIHADSASLLAQACRQGLEGIIAKRADSSYSSRRSRNWVKCRCEKPFEGLIVGFVPQTGSANAVGALLLASRSESGQLVYAGRVGTGFSDRLRRDLFDVLSASQVERAPLAEVPRSVPKSTIWTEPVHRAHAQFLEWTPSGTMRQPKLIDIEYAESLRAPRAAKQAPHFHVSSPERVLDQESGVTKGRLAEYYAAAAERMLPYLADRPLATLRCPEGLSGACFFQKHWMHGLGRAVRKVHVREKEGDDEPYIAIRDAAGLRELVQMGAIELHPWGSRVASVEKPDILIFDLDPGDDVSWEAVLEAADLVRRSLEGLGLATFPKLSGGKGLHIVLPIEPELEWPEVKRFCETVARTLAMERPKLLVANMSKAQRKGRIFLDYLRNGRGATAVAPYSVRAKKGLPVAMPIAWEEAPALQPNSFDIEAALARLNSSTDPWEGFFERRASLEQAIR